MDTAVDAVLDFLFSDEPSNAIFNVAHPHPVPLRDILEIINHTLDQSLEFMPLGDWVTLLARKASGAATLGDLVSLHQL